MRRAIKLLLVCTISWNLFACGTIFYPERKGQVDGRLDVGVVILNSLGLLLYFLPGVIAFAVDFSNGTIYLPGGKTSSLSDAELGVLARNDVNEIDVQAILQRRGWVSSGEAMQVKAAPIDAWQKTTRVDALFVENSQINKLKIIRLASDE